ncbi:type I secretion system permease/ATPase [Ectothiorhodospiraceae bacterium BW-2]|nr:type I secretion system permease/ATPase [Ectothiorhodospiraceae bacterium BW-2]
MKKEQNKTSITHLERTLKNVKRSFLYVGLFSFFINLLMLVPSIYMLQVYDRVLTSQSVETLGLLTLIVVFLFATMGFLEIIRSRILVRIGNKIDIELNTQLYDTIFYSARMSPENASVQPLNDLTKLRQFMTGNGVFAFFDSPWFPIYLFVMYLFSPWFALFTLFAAAVIFTITLINDKTTKKFMEEANKMSFESVNYVDKNIANNEIIHAMGMNEQIKKRWLDKHLEFLNLQSNASDTSGKWSNTSKTLRQLFASLTYGIGAYLVIEGSITPGMIIAGAVLLGRALAPIDLLTNSWKSFSDARGAYKRLNGLLEDLSTIQNTTKLPAPKGEISVEKVVVVPPHSQIEVLKNITMNIPAGTAVGVLGPSASGKSTLLRAILGVWPLKEGIIRLDGADIHQWDSKELGKYIGYLPQDIELFEGTVSENVSRFAEIESEEVVKAANIAGAHEMILKLPNGYDTLIGPKGTILSAGQRQRVGLVRALYKSPPLIVLDEPNSNLDEDGEKKLLEAIIAMKQSGSTIIIVTHRSNILSALDTIAILANGELKAYGNKEDVVKIMQFQALQNYQKMKNGK